MQSLVEIGQVMGEDENVKSLQTETRTNSGRDVVRNKARPHPSKFGFHFSCILSVVQGRQTVCQTGSAHLYLHLPQWQALLQRGVHTRQGELPLYREADGPQWGGHRDGPAAQPDQSTHTTRRTKRK